MEERPQTWHYGLLARWWAGNEPEPGEVDYIAGVIERFGQPALDLGAGSGRILIPLLERGFDVDGVDISADMLEVARKAAHERKSSPTLRAQAFHELDLPRTYRTVFSIGALGIGGSRAQDLEALRRIHDQLEPGGALMVTVELPWSCLGEDGWLSWVPDHRREAPSEWPAKGSRRVLPDGDELELIIRDLGVDPLGLRHTMEIKARLWRDGRVVQEEEPRTLVENLYFPPELILMLETAGFTDIAVEGSYTGQPATPQDATVVFLARR